MDCKQRTIVPTKTYFGLQTVVRRKQSYILWGKYSAKQRWAAPSTARPSHAGGSLTQRLKRRSSCLTPPPPVPSCPPSYKLYSPSVFTWLAYTAHSHSRHRVAASRPCTLFRHKCCRVAPWLESAASSQPPRQTQWSTHLPPAFAHSFTNPFSSSLPHSLAPPAPTHPPRPLAAIRPHSHPINDSSSHSLPPPLARGVTPSSPHSPTHSLPTLTLSPAPLINHRALTLTQPCMHVFTR